MFLQNKYTLWYFNIIQFAKKRNIIKDGLVLKLSK